RSIAAGGNKLHTVLFRKMRVLHLFHHPYPFQRKVTEGQQRLPYVIAGKSAFLQQQNPPPFVRQNRSGSRARRTRSNDQHIILIVHIPLDSSILSFVLSEVRFP